MRKPKHTDGKPHYGVRPKKGMPPALAETEAMTMRCPNRHALPHRTGRGDCTPLYCAGSDAIMRTGAGAKAMGRKAATVGLATAERKELRTSEEKRLGYAADRRAARDALLNTPQNLTGVDAENYVTTKMNDLTPFAMARLEYELLYGTDQEQSDSAREVLDRAGHGKKDSAGGGAGPILIINNSGGGTLEIPWAKRTEPVVATVAEGAGAKDST